LQIKRGLLCAHALIGLYRIFKSHLAIKKFEKLKFKKLRNLHFVSFYLHCISFFGTVFQKNCTAPSQSELIEKSFQLYYSNSHNVYQTYEIDACCSLNLQKSSFNFTRELDIRIPGGYNLKRFCQSMNLICRAVTTGGFGVATPPPPPPPPANNFGKRIIN
jgi:hypothetical protein